MRIRFTNHARQRMAERRIRVSDIRFAVEHPDYKRHTFDGEAVIRKSLGKEILEIIYKIEKGNILIITVYYI